MPVVNVGEFQPALCRPCSRSFQASAQQFPQLPEQSLPPLPSPAEPLQRRRHGQSQSQDQQLTVGMHLQVFLIPSIGGQQVFLSMPASRATKRKGLSAPGSGTGKPCFAGDMPGRRSDLRKPMIPLVLTTFYFKLSVAFPGRTGNPIFQSR